jgi:hypothetical protein
MQLAPEMSSGAMIYIPSIIKTGSGIRKLVRGIHRQQSDFISIFVFSQNKESWLKAMRYTGINLPSAASLSSSAYENPLADSIIIGSGLT